MKKVILLSIFAICTTTNTAQKNATPEKIIVFHCSRAILAQLPNTEREVVQRIGIVESFSNATLTESQVRTRINQACLNYNTRYRTPVISPDSAKQTADKLIAISVSVSPVKHANL